MSSYSVATGYELGIRGSELVELRWAALVHDVWKLALPVQLLEKPSPLDEHEMKKVRDATQEITDVEQRIAAILQHQYDSNATQLASKIILACTAFDVMSMDQPWKSAIGEDAALEELKEHAGTQFDPKVLEAFFKVQPLIQPVHI